MISDKNFTELAENLQDELRQSITQINLEDVQRFLSELLGAERIFIAGKGRSGLQMRSFAMRLMHLGLQVYVVDDVTTPAVGSGDLLIVGSASGKTSSLVAYAEITKKIGAKLIAITSNTDNPISKRSSVNIVIHAPSHKNSSRENSVPSILPLGGLFELALGFLLNLLVVQLVKELGIEESEMISRHTNLE